MNCWAERLPSVSCAALFWLMLVAWVLNSASNQSTVWLLDAMSSGISLVRGSTVTGVDSLKPDMVPWLFSDSLP